MELRTVAAAIVVAGLLVSGSILVSSEMRGATRSTETVSVPTTLTSTATVTSTETTKVTVSSPETIPQGSLLLSTTSGPWVFDALINSTSVKVGGSLLVSGNLTYLGNASTTILAADPLIYVGVFNSSGELLQGAVVPAYGLNETVTPGKTLQSGGICVSMTATQRSSDCLYFNEPPVTGTFTLEVYPAIESEPGDEGLAENLLILTPLTLFIPCYLPGCPVT